MKLMHQVQIVVIWQEFRFFISIFDLFIFYVKKSGSKTTTDEDFQMYLDEIRPQIAKVPLSEQISTLAR